MRNGAGLRSRAVLVFPGRALPHDVGRGALSGGAQSFLRPTRTPTIRSPAASIESRCVFGVSSRVLVPRTKSCRANQMASPKLLGRNSAHVLRLSSSSHAFRVEHERL